MVRLWKIVNRDIEEKIDISDGLYRVNLAIEDIPKLGEAFPVKKGEKPLVTLPLVLPMGWANSPPIFCAATKNAADLANNAITSSLVLPEHPLDALASTMEFSQWTILSLRLPATVPA